MKIGTKPAPLLYSSGHERKGGEWTSHVKVKNHEVFFIFLFLFFGFQASAYLNPHESMTQSYAERYTYIWMGTIVEVMCSTPSVIFFNLIFLFLREEHWLHSLEWGSHTWMIEHVFAISSGFYDFLGFFLWFHPYKAWRNCKKSIYFTTIRITYYWHIAKFKIVEPKGTCVRFRFRIEELQPTKFHGI